MAIVIDGITLPEFQELHDEGVATSDFPYRVMVNFGAAGEAYQFVLIATKSPIYRIPEEIVGIEVFGAFEAGYFISQCVFRLDDPDYQNAIWAFPALSLDEQYSSAANVVTTEMFKTIFWANYDVLEITNANEDTGEFETGEIYFPNSETPAEPEPEYGKIRRQYMRDIGDAIRRKTGKKDKIPTPQLASEIDSIVTADNALVLKDNERIYQVGNAENSLYILQHEAAAFGSLSS